MKLVKLFVAISILNATAMVGIVKSRQFLPNQIAVGASPSVGLPLAELVTASPSADLVPSSSSHPPRVPSSPRTTATTNTPAPTTAPQQDLPVQDTPAPATPTPDVSTPTPQPAQDNRCLIQIDGGTYDVSQFRSQHSGGNIFQCGTDMSSVFWGQHNQRQLDQMQRYRI